MWVENYDVLDFLGWGWVDFVVIIVFIVSIYLFEYFGFCEVLFIEVDVIVVEYGLDVYEICWDLDLVGSWVEKIGENLI